jgi:starvation-inducible outer membrane lipoprotein
MMRSPTNRHVALHRAFPDPIQFRGKQYTFVSLIDGTDMGTDYRTRQTIPESDQSTRSWTGSNQIRHPPPTPPSLLRSPHLFFSAFVFLFLR